MSYIGTNKIGGMHLNSTEIAKAYLGSTLVFEKSVAPVLPYIPVDYIETDGVAYIDTGIMCNTPISARFKITPILETNTVSYFGASSSSTTRIFIRQWGTSISGTYKNYFSFNYNTNVLQGLNFASYIDGLTSFYFEVSFKKDTQVFKIKKEGDSSYASINNNSPEEVTTNKSIFLFVFNNIGTPSTQHSSKGTKGHFFQIYSDDTFTNLVFDGVACYYNGEYGLWDNVTNKFFGNAAGSGAFTGQV